MNLFLNRPVAFSAMVKPTGPLCNLNCTYCYYLEKQKLFQHATNFRMEDDILENFIKDYIQSQQVPVVSFIWQGGEPCLLGIDYFRKIVKLQDKYAGEKKIENSIQTNGTRLNDEWCQFFKYYNFLVGISIDGPEEIHNKFRIYKNGENTFTDVMHGIELLKKHNVDFNTLTVVNRYNSRYPLEIYNFLKLIGSGFIQFLPVVERCSDINGSGLRLVNDSYKGEANVTEWSVLPEDYGSFLITIFNQWVQIDVGKIFVQMFDVTLANWVGVNPGLCVFGETCGNAIAIEHNGDVFACDHYVYPEYYLGNISKTSLIDMLSSDKQFEFGNHKLTSLPPECLNCDYRFACHGECPKHRFEKSENGEPGLNYLCKAYKMFFSYVHPFMQYMGDELAAHRPPANICLWIRSLDVKSRNKLFTK